MARTKGKLIAVTSMKGGVGKTILTTQLASIYASMNKRVLIIDMDLYGGAIALNLNLKPEKTIYQYVDDISNNRYRDFHDYITTYNDKIDVISCPKDPRQGSKIDAKYVEMLIDNAMYRYDVILLDMSHILNNINIVLLDSATQILYVMNNDAMDLKNTKSFMAILDDIEKENVTVVLNNSKDPNLNYFNEFEMKNIIKHKIDFTIPKSAHISNITKQIVDGTLIPKDNNLEDSILSRKDLSNMKDLAICLLEGEE